MLKELKMWKIPNINELFRVEAKQGPIAFINAFDSALGKMFKGQASEWMWNIIP